MESAVEAELRTQIMAWVGERAEANGGFLRRDELLDFHLGGEKLPVIDYSRGIRNPASFGSTLSIVSWTTSRRTGSSSSRWTRRSASSTTPPT